MTIVLLFQQYTASPVAKIYHPSTVIEWEANMEKADYEYKNNLGVNIPSIKSKYFIKAWMYTIFQYDYLTKFSGYK